jgi:hypothetical protein
MAISVHPAMTTETTINDNVRMALLPSIRGLSQTAWVVVQEHVRPMVNL